MLFVLEGLHLDLILVLKVTILALFLIDFALYFGLFLNYLLLLEEILPILLDFEFQLLVGLNKFPPFLLDLRKKSFILVFLLVKFLDFVLQLLDQVEVGGSYLGVVGLDVAVFLGVFGR